MLPLEVATIGTGGERPWGYTILGRYKDLGIVGLEDRSLGGYAESLTSPCGDDAPCTRAESVQLTH
jgi:hypothetical protein